MNLRRSTMRPPAKRMCRIARAVARLPDATFGARLGFDVAMRDAPRVGKAAHSGIIASKAVSRSDLLRRFERWTYGRKIKLCTGLSANVIVASEVILAHGLTQDEIDRWMEAYRKGDFEALKVGYPGSARQKQKAGRPPGQNIRTRYSSRVGIANGR
jgi:Protein of unknown function (DUF1153)